MQINRTDRSLTITRELGAPAALVFAAWTKPEHLAKWFGPSGFSTATHSIDVRPGGEWRYDMRGPDGHVYANRIVYSRVIPDREIAYTHAGTPETEPVCFETVVKFDPVPGKPERTLITMTMSFPNAAMLNDVIEKYGALEGGKQTTQRLDQYVTMLHSNGAAEREFVISRVFDAPVERVWEVWTRLEHLQRWFGPKNVSLSDCSLDLRPGGLFIYRMAFDDADHWGRWVFREIVPPPNTPSRLEFVVSFSNSRGGVERNPWQSDWPMHMLSLVTFEHHAGIGRGTLVTVHWKPLDASPAECKVFFEGLDSMQNGWSGTFDKLAEFLQALDR